MKKILIIENGSIAYNFINSIYKDFKIIHAENSLDGLKLAIKSYPDLLVLDIDITPVNGFMLAKELRHHFFTSDIPIIFLTKDVITKDIKEEAKKIRIKGFIAKPICYKKAQKTLDKILLDKKIQVA